MPGSPDPAAPPDGTGAAAPPAPPAPPASPTPQPAENAQSQEEDDDFQFLLCESCGQDSPQPQLLGCLHSLCPSCLGHAKPSGLCPVCRAATAATAGTDNALFASLRGRLAVWRQLRSPGGPCCGRCRAEAARVWCEECEEFLCGRCLEEHRWWHKKGEHRVRCLDEMRRTSASSFLQESRGSCSLFCTSASHAGESRVCSIYCPRCERALCCPCALLDTRHAPFRDLRAESRRRRAELRELHRDLRQLRDSFAASLERLRAEAARRDEARRLLRERVRAISERLQRLVRGEAEELRALLERGEAEQLRAAEGALRRVEAAERLAEKLGRYGGEQELMDMEPLVRGALLELRRLRPPEVREMREPRDIAECRARLRAMVQRVTGRSAAAGAPEAADRDRIPVLSLPGTDVPEDEAALENNQEVDPSLPQIQSVSSGLDEIPGEQLLPGSSWHKRPPPCAEKSSQISPKILKLECEQEPGPSCPKSRRECHRDAGSDSVIVCSSDSDEDTVVVTVTPEPPP